MKPSSNLKTTLINTPCSVKFLSPEFILYLCKSTIQSCIEHYYHVWTSAASCFLKLLNKLQNWICRTVPLFAASPESLTHCWNGPSLTLFYKCYFGRCSSDLAHLVPLPYFWEHSNSYSDWFHDFSVTIPRWYKDTHVNSFFPCTARLWNSLPIECFPLT